MATSSTPDPHSNWLTVGEGLLLTKRVLEPYIKQVVNNWHQILLKRLKKIGQCSSQSTCNPLNHASLCRSCKVWFDELINHHTGKADMISWNNTNCTKWAKQQGAWEVAKVFMANLGKMKSKVIDEKSTDITGLLTILRFFPNEAFGNPVSRPVRQSIEDVSNKARNPWAHSARQEMTTGEKKKALNSLKEFLENRALSSVPGVEKGLNDLQTLDSNGITDISISESKCLMLLGQEVPARVSSIERKLTNLESTVEEKQKHLESRQDTFEEKVLENLDEVNTQMQAISEKANSDAVCEPLRSCLPDLQDKVFGRDAVIDDVASLIMQHQKPCVVLTGAPGFGKTTVAINLAHKLRANKVCLFVSLREMHSIKDVCSALLAQVGQHPKENEKEELLHWARSLKEEVVFILDNAEEILQVDKDAFCGLLQGLRTINSRYIQFLITSRESFAILTMEVTLVEIKKLNPEEGIQVIRSMVPEDNTCGDSETFLTELVNLCGGIPLALRMIGSILDWEVDITALIQELKSSPMKTLEDRALPSYHQSVCAAFECSFQKLEDSLKAKLMRLSVFRGPFTQQAAARILDCQEGIVSAGKVLKELTNKSLLTKSSKRYEMHSLIQKYLKEIKSEPYHNDLDAAANKFIDYYASVVIEGHKLFWSKDQFKRSIEMFRNDNLNIEIALEMCYQDPEKMKKFFSFSVWSVSMYLEMCISLEKLNKFLESCSSSAASQNDKGMEMEAQCWLAYYEWKKAGYQSEKYQNQFSNAKKLYEEEEKSLRPSQKWLYKHSYGLHLDLNRINDTSTSTLDEAFQVAKEAEQIAERNTEGTDLSLTLNQLGIIEKHRKNYEGAECYLKKSHEKRMEILGEEHILSVSKQLGDLYLEQKKYDEALVLYEKGLDTYKAIHMDKEKQCINLLKNMGSCCFELEKVDESLTCFHKAMELAERWLKGDQTAKVHLNSVLAIAYDFKGNRSQAHECVQNALQMAERLKMSLSEKHKQNLERIMKEWEGAETAD